MDKVRDNMSNKKLSQYFENIEFQKTIFNKASDALILFDQQTGEILDLNETALNLYGYTREEMMAMSSFDVSSIPHNNHQVIREGKIKVSDKIHKKKDGTQFPVDIKIAYHNYEGKKLCLLAVRDFSEQKALEEKIRIDEAHYKELFENNPEAMLFYEIDTLKFIAVNDAAVKQYGYSKEEFSKMTVADIRPKEDIPLFLDHLMEYKNVDLRSSLWKHKRKDGSIIFVEITSHSINYNGKKARFVLANDITEKKVAYQRIQQLSLAVQQSPVTIVITDTEGNIEYINQKGIDLTGYAKEEIIGKNPRVFSAGEKTKEEYKILWDTIKSGSEWRGQFHNKKKNGELYWEYATISPIKNDEGEIINFLAIKEDITERKKYQKELIAAKEKAEEMNRIKSVFFSNMSHELRTPLSGILGFSELLLEDIHDQEQKKMIEAISMNGQRLLNTLNEILHISKLESENPVMKFEDICVPVFIEETIKEFEGNLLTKGLFIKLNYSHKELYVNLDKEIFRTVLSNLITNAIKFTSTGGITISCKKMIGDEENILAVEILDTGIGISDENQKIIFDEFRQASEGFNRYFEGVGLGLTVAKKYTELLGGKIYLESNLGRGSKFILEFPISTAKSAASIDYLLDNGKTYNEGDDKKPLVLLVEDDYMNSDLIKKSLESICILHTVESGEEALIFARRNKYDTILMDIGLGLGMNGLEATKQIRSIPGYKDTPIIAVTAYAMNGDKEKFLSSGLTGYISKPFKMRELVDVLGKALKLI